MSSGSESRAVLGVDWLKQGFTWNKVNTPAFALAFKFQLSNLSWFAVNHRDPQARAFRIFRYNFEVWNQLARCRGSLAMGEH